MDKQETASLGETLARLFWMMVGPMFLLLCAFTIAKTGNGWLTGADIAYLAVLAGVLLARWLEFRGGHARTAEGDPATPEQLRRYLIGAVVLGLVGWVIANVIGNYLLAP